MTLESVMCEHQAPGIAGQVFPHAIFRNLVRDTRLAENDMQMFTPADPLGIQHYYRLRPMR